MKTVQLGEPANITCALPDGVSSKGVHWYKQSVGDTLKLIVSLLKTATPEYGQETFKSRFQAHFDKKFSNLTILKAVQDDEGIYHCGMIEWINLEWTGTYLLVKGKLVIHCPTFINFKGVFGHVIKNIFVFCIPQEITRQHQIILLVNGQQC